MKLKNSIFLLFIAFPAALFAEEVGEQPVLTITADPFAPSYSEHGRPVSIITKEELERKATTTLGETIGLEPGVSTSYFGPGASRPVIRANAGERIRVLKNGIGTFDVSNTSEDHQVSAHPLAAETIEILRGPETLLFGSSAIGGVVNVTDNSIPEKEIGKDITGSFDYRQGTGDDELTGAVKLEGQAGKFNWHVDGFHQDTNDIDIPGEAESARLRALEEAEEGEHHEEGEEGEEHHEHEEAMPGVLPNSATRSKGFTAGGSYIWDKGFFGAAVTQHSSAYGIPGHMHHEEELHEHGEEEHADEFHEEEHEEHHAEGGEGVSIDLDQWRVDLRGGVSEVSDSIEKIKVNVGASSYDHVENEGEEVGTRFENEALESRVELHHAKIGDLEGIAGLQVEASDFSAVGEEAFLPSTTRFAPALFVYENLPLNETLKLQFGGRVEHVRLNPDELASNSFTPFGFSAGIVADPTGDAEYTLGLNVAYTQRAPAATELYADGAHIARQIVEIGDSNLDVEQSVGADVSIKKNTGFVTGGLNLFVQNYNDYINLAGTGEEDEGLPVFAYEDIRAFFWGSEAEATLHLHELFDLWTHDLDLGVQVDWVQARNLTDSSDLPRIPPLRTIVGLEYGWKTSFRTRVEGVFVATQSRTAEFELPTDAYQLLNASMEYSIAPVEQTKLTLFVRGTNLTDEEARIHSSFIKDLAPLMSRSVLFGVQGVF